jgi:hypothetical protein
MRPALALGVCVLIMLIAAIQWSGYWQIDAMHREWKQQLQLSNQAGASAPRQR